MSTHTERIDQYLSDSARHHRHAQAWSRVLLGLCIVFIVLLFLRGLWPPSEEQLRERDERGTPAG